MSGQLVRQNRPSANQLYQLNHSIHIPQTPLSYLHHVEREQNSSSFPSNRHSPNCLPVESFTDGYRDNPSLVAPLQHTCDCLRFLARFSRSCELSFSISPISFINSAWSAIFRPRQLTSWQSSPSHHRHSMGLKMKNIHTFKEQLYIHRHSFDRTLTCDPLLSSDWSNIEVFYLHNIYDVNEVEISTRYSVLPDKNIYSITREQLRLPRPRMNTA